MQKKQTLRKRFLHISIPLIFLSVIGVFTIIELMTHYNATIRLQQRLESLIHIQSKGLATPIWDLNSDHIEASLQSIMTDREIVAARLYGEDGSLMDQVGEEVSNDSNLIVLQQPITYNTESNKRTIGKLELIGTKRYVWEQTHTRLLIAASIALLAVLMEIAAALFALQRIIEIPLEKLLSAIESARTDRERQKVEWHTNDEIGQVINAFNEMQNLQEVSEKNLRQAHDTLEERVAERTEELSKTLLELENTQAQLVDNLSRLEQELEAARQLQLSMVPQTFPEVTAAQPIQIYAMMQPAREVGGDLYDFFYADKHTFCFLIGDVSDKGTPAALFMARTRSLIRLAVEQWRRATGETPAPDQIMEAVNQELCQNNNARMFVTLFLGLLNVRTGKVRYTNGGHPAPYRLQNDNTIAVIDTNKPDVPLGVMTDSAYHVGELCLQPNDSLFLYSDGVSEAANAAGELYTATRLRTALNKSPDATPEQMIIQIELQLAEFVDTETQFDDVTMLALRWQPMLHSNAA